MITSSKPSPLTSPAALTARPKRSSSAVPLSLKPLLPFRDERFKVGANPVALPKIT
jgi:hypothetical protein